MTGFYANERTIYQTYCMNKPSIVERIIDIYWIYSKNSPNIIQFIKNLFDFISHVPLSSSICCLY